MKLWQKDITLDQQIEQFTIGKDQELDLQLASFDVLGSLAHIQMLEKIGETFSITIPEAFFIITFSTLISCNLL